MTELAQLRRSLTHSVDAVRDLRRKAQVEQADPVQLDLVLGHLLGTLQAAERFAEDASAVIDSSIGDE
jgi:hypothetical protein